MRRSDHEWTPDEEERLFALVLAGERADSLARELDLTPSSVQSKLTRALGTCDIRTGRAAHAIRRQRARRRDVNR